MSRAARALSPVLARTAHCHVLPPTKVKFTFPAWVTIAAIGIRRSSNADIFTIAPLDRHLAGNLLLFNSIVSYSNEKPHTPTSVPTDYEKRREFGTTGKSAKPVKPRNRKYFALP